MIDFLYFLIFLEDVVVRFVGILWVEVEYFFLRFLVLIFVFFFFECFDLVEYWFL